MLNNRIWISLNSLHNVCHLIVTVDVGHVVLKHLVLLLSKDIRNHVFAGPRVVLILEMAKNNFVQGQKTLNLRK